VFPEKEFEEIENEGSKKKITSDKIYKIKYSINILPITSQYMREIDLDGKLDTKIENEQTSLLRLCVE